MARRKKSPAERVYLRLLAGTFVLILGISLLLLAIRLFTDGGDSSGPFRQTGDTYGNDGTDGTDGWMFSDVSPEEALDLSEFDGLTLPRTYSREYALYEGDFAQDTVDFLGERKFVIVIDPGHQDSTRADDVWLSPYLDPDLSSSWVYGNQARIGTTGVATGVSEYQVTHAVAKLLKTELEARGYTVYLTKSSVSDVMTGPQRAKVANRHNADLAISLHCDGYAQDASVSGSLVQVPEEWAGYPDRRLAFLSRIAGEEVLSAYCTATGLKNRGVQEISRTSLFSWSKTPSILLEMGYMTNRSDDRNLNDDAFRAAMVTGIADGIDAYCRILQATQMALLEE